jgi:hypothetical protein
MRRVGAVGAQVGQFRLNQLSKRGLRSDSIVVKALAKAGLTGRGRQGPKVCASQVRCAKPKLPPLGSL